MAQINLRIDGMHCGACVKRVTQALQRMNGIVVEEVRIGAARIHDATTEQNPEPIIAALEKAGFTAHLEQ